MSGFFKKNMLVACLLCKYVLCIEGIFVPHATTIKTDDKSKKSSEQFILITTLYNEKDEKRRREFVTCMEKNLQHPMIEKVHVFYDTTKDDSENALLSYLKSKNITLSFIQGRARYSDLFATANKSYLGRKIIISNADIFFDEKLNLLSEYDLTDKFLALTRWDVGQDGLLKEFCVGGNSQDTWIFNSPIPSFLDLDIQMGVLGCENALAYLAWAAHLDVHNPCLTLHCCHLHLSEVRNYAKEWPYRDRPKILAIAKETLSSALSKIKC